MASIWTPPGDPVTYPVPPATSASSTKSAERGGEEAGRRSSSSADVRRLQSVVDKALNGNG